MTAIACVPDSGLGQAEERGTMVTRLALQTVGMRQLSTHTGTLTHLIRGELHGADTQHSLWTHNEYSAGASLGLLITTPSSSSLHRAEHSAALGSTRQLVQSRYALCKAAERAAVV